MAFTRRLFLLVFSILLFMNFTSALPIATSTTPLTRLRRQRTSDANVSTVDEIASLSSLDSRSSTGADGSTTIIIGIVMAFVVPVGLCICFFAQCFAARRKALDAESADDEEYDTNNNRDYHRSMEMRKMRHVTWTGSSNSSVARMDAPPPPYEAGTFIVNPGASRSGGGEVERAVTVARDTVVRRSS